MITSEYSSVEIIIRYGEHVRKIVARVAKDVRVRTDQNLDPDLSISAGGGILARFLDDDISVELTFTALLDVETGTTLQESRQP